MRAPNLGAWVAWLRYPRLRERELTGLLGAILMKAVLIGLVILTCGARAPAGETTGRDSTIKESPLKVDPRFGRYHPVGGIGGSLSSAGSDTLVNVVTLWAETFNRFYPGVKVQVEGKGSGTAPSALLAGTAQLGPMSRPLKDSEVESFEKKFGHQPTRFRVAIDAVAVYVNKDNPIKGLTFAQVDAIFSRSRNAGHPQGIDTWGQLGLTGVWASRPISLYGRNSDSGTHGYFKEHILRNGDYRAEVKEQAGSAAVVQSVTADRYAIGYSGIGYAAAGVRAVPLAEKGEKFIEATAENAYSGTYPVSRFLFIYVNKTPGEALDPLVGEFVRMVLSREGQEVVLKDNYYPLPFSVAAEELKKLR